MKIAIVKRHSDYHASIDKPGCWGCGRSPIEAIGQLVAAHAEEFQIEIEGGGFPTKLKKPIVIGDIVKFKDKEGSENKEGWYRVRSLWKTGTVANLSGVHALNHLYHKGILVSELIEDQAGFNEMWIKSETYKSS